MVTAKGFDVVSDARHLWLGKVRARRECKYHTRKCDGKIRFHKGLEDILSESSRRLWLAGSLLGLLGVAAGAFGAHALQARLEPDLLGIFETAARYQMYHAIAILVSARAASAWRSGAAAAAGWLFVGGILVFSGSLYLLALSGIRWLGAITPIGGAAFLTGWACLGLAGWRAGVEEASRGRDARPGARMR
jgi:uncharacterized membrane protein YgdD (TMEM256/DUF423 family)